MTDENQKPKLELVPPTEEELDEEEQEFRALRRDLPGVKGASAAGIVAISVGKAPAKNEFFRSHPEFRPIIPMVNCEMGMEKPILCGDARHGGAAGGHRHLGYRPCPLSHHHLARCGADRSGAAGQQRRRAERVRPHQGNRHAAGARAVGAAVHRSWKTAATRFFPHQQTGSPTPQWPTLKPAKIFRLAFRDKNRLIDSPEHTLFQKWAARDRDPA